MKKNVIDLKPIVRCETIPLESGRVLKIYQRDNTFTGIMKRVVKQDLDDYLRKHKRK